MATKIITFTTKQKDKPQGNFLSKSDDAVSVNIEETTFPTKGGDKKVKRIRFFPNDSISEEDINKALQISDGEVKKLTFEIEIDGSEIEAKEPPQNNNLNASSSESAGKLPLLLAPQVSQKKMIETTKG